MVNVNEVDILIERPTFWNARTKTKQIFLQVTQATGIVLEPRKRDVKIMGANIRIQIVPLTNITETLKNVSISNQN